MEIALASWHVPRAIATACMGCLLVLNMETGLVSPQFHVKLNSNFQTLREKGAHLPTSTWQIKCGFVQQPTKAVQRDPAPETGPMDGALPMQQPERVQPAAPTNNDPEPAPEAKGNRRP